MPNVSYAEAELLLADKETDSKYTVREIIGKSIEKRVTYYKIQWNGYKKADATWEPKTELIKDGLGNLISEFEAKIR